MTVRLVLRDGAIILNLLPALVNFVWHTDESEDDAAFFFMMNTSFEEHSFSNFLVLQVGDDNPTKARLTQAISKWASEPAA